MVKPLYFFKESTSVFTWLRNLFRSSNYLIDGEACCGSCYRYNYVSAESTGINFVFVCPSCHETNILY